MDRDSAAGLLGFRVWDTGGQANALAVDSDRDPSLQCRPPDGCNSDSRRSRAGRDRHTHTAKHHAHVYTDATSDRYTRTG